MPDVPLLYIFSTILAHRDVFGQMSVKNLNLLEIGDVIIPELKLLGVQARSQIAKNDY